VLVSVPNYSRNKITKDYSHLEAYRTLEVFKARLDRALSYLWKVSLPMAGGLELNDLYGPF